MYGVSESANCVTTVSHTPGNPGATRHLRGHVDAHRCCAKSLIGTALVGFGIRQHARAESISKRAPSTTRTSLRLESITCERSRTVLSRSLTTVCSSWLRTPADAVSPAMTVRTHQSLGHDCFFFRRMLPTVTSCPNPIRWLATARQSGALHIVFRQLGWRVDCVRSTQ